MSGRKRLVWAIVSTALEEAALAAAVLIGLPFLGIDLPLPVLGLLMAALAAWAVFTYRLGSRALRRPHVSGLTSMVGSHGETVTPLAPGGTVKIKGELWAAQSAEGNIPAQTAVTVTAQSGLALTVRPRDAGPL